MFVNDGNKSIMHNISFALKCKTEVLKTNKTTDGKTLQLTFT